MEGKMVKGHLLFLVATSMKGDSRMGNITGEDCLPGIIQTSMRVNLKMAKNMDTAYILRQMGPSMLEDLRMD